MIQSSIFSLDEPVWDPKVIRERLFIPEDQLNILANIPGWSKVTDNENTLRLEDTTFESSQFHVPVASKNFQKNKQNFELFDKYLKLQEDVLKIHEASKKEFTRSISLYEIDKIHGNLSNKKQLKRSISLPILYQLFDNSFIQTLHQNSVSTKENLSNSVKILPFEKPVEYSVGLGEKNIVLMSDTRNIFPSENEKNTVLLSDTRKPVENPTKYAVILGENNAVLVSDTRNVFPFENEKNTGLLSDTRKPVENPTKYAVILDENNAVLMSDTRNILSFENEKNTGLLSDTRNILSIENPTKYSVVEGERETSLLSDKIKILSVELPKSVGEKNTSILNTTSLPKNNLNVMEVVSQFPGSVSIPVEVVENISMPNTVSIANITENSSNQPMPISNIILPEKNSQYVGKPYDSELYENSLVSYIVKETVPMNVNLSASSEKDGMIYNPEKLTEVSETPAEVLPLIEDASCEQTILTVSLDVKNKENSKLKDTRKEDLYNQKPSDRKIDIIPNKSVAVESKGVSEKRKLGTKNKSSKKRRNTGEKPEHAEIRNIKRAGEIYYSAEDIQIMLDIMQQFS